MATKKIIIPTFISDSDSDSDSDAPVFLPSEPSIDMSEYRDIYPELDTQIIPDFWVLPNKVIFLNWVNTIFGSKIDITKDEASCACLNELCKNSTLFPHQKLVKEFFQQLSPYRGIFLYHGLGVGKTCASIAIAEGMANNRKVVFLSKASLEQNFRNELKFCGNDYYIKNQNKWVFVECDRTTDKCLQISKDKGIPLEIINKNNGVWLIDISSDENNYDTLSDTNKKQIDNQIEDLINYKYSFMHHDASNLGKKIEESVGNPFDYKLLIIDEVHNITNSMVNGGKIASLLEERIMSAKNLRIVALSGTPIVNNIFEISKLFNLLRGPIETYIIQYTDLDSSQEEIIKIKLMAEEPSVDYIKFYRKLKKLIITRNPVGFIKTPDKSGIIRGDHLTEEDFKLKAEKIGYKVKYFEENNNLSIYKGDNPYLMRIVLTKNEES